ncbi:MAG: HAMP domain-containing protein [Actinobacteria bacterium]|uniref:Signal transduction histidine-protein kinase/phosphatase MprB n=1 Tax=freshwater metagenome TaxID=449393 RepID=A0A6J6NGH7_9ZZZZ|nr:HAMP domain-containing protein [Actinomycetota bacterium]
MIGTAFALAVATLVAGVVLAFALRLLPTVRLQVTGLALVAVGLPLGVVLASGWVMFHMGDDVKILAVSSAAALSAIVAGLMLARFIVSPIDRLRETSAQIASGDLGVRASEAGPAELAELGRSFNSMAGSLEELFDARRQLVAWASHDLRTPLTAMQASLEALEDGLVDPKEYVPALHAQVRLLSGIVDDLFELARIDAGVLAIVTQNVVLDELVSGCLEGLAPEAASRGVRLGAELGQTLPPVECAPEKIERVLYNLLTNALRHTPPDGSVVVTAKADGDRVEIAVEDTGEGIAPERAERIFDRFWKADASRRPGGSGLGLAIARGLIDAHGGRIWAEARREGGTRVVFTLPVAQARP